VSVGTTQTDAVRDEIDAFPQQILRVVQIEEMRRYWKLLRVPHLDDGFPRVLRHLLRCAEVVVDAELEPVDTHRGDLLDLGGRALSGRRRRG
jgi:hypothetical protein